MPQPESLPTDDSLYVVNVNSNGAMNTYTPAELATEVAATMQANSQWVLPAGMVAPYAGSSAPTGWLLCDGSPVSRSTYAALFAAIGTTYGSGDGSTTFNVPDTRGIFISGVGSQTISGITYTRTLGGKQGDQFQSHYHPIGLDTGTIINGALAAGTSNTQFAKGNGAANGTILPSLSVPASDGTNGTPRTGSETRPANIAMNYIIKV